MSVKKLNSVLERDYTLNKTIRSNNYFLLQQPNKSISTHLTKPCGDTNSSVEMYYCQFNPQDYALMSFSTMLQLNKSRRQRWKERHNEFRRGINGIPFTDDSEELSGLYDSSSSGYEKPATWDASLKTCETCGRSFNENAYAKHIAHCGIAATAKSLSYERTSEISEAMRRFRARMSYRPTITSRKENNTPSAGSNPSPRSGDPTSMSSATLSCDCSTTDTCSTTPLPSPPNFVDGSFWDSAALQCSNCNQRRPARHDVSQIQRELNETTSPPNSTHSRYQGNRTQDQQSQSQQHPRIHLDGIPSPSDCYSSTSSASTSSSTLSSMSTCVSVPTDRLQPSAAPYTNPNKTIHCPWSPTVSSFTRYSPVDTDQCDNSQNTSHEYSGASMQSLQWCNMDYEQALQATSVSPISSRPSNPITDHGVPVVQTVRARQPQNTRVCRCHHHVLRSPECNVQEHQRQSDGKRDCVTTSLNKSSPTASGECAGQNQQILADEGSKCVESVGRSGDRFEHIESRSPAQTRTHFDENFSEDNVDTSMPVSVSTHPSCPTSWSKQSSNLNAALQTYTPGVPTALVFTKALLTTYNRQATSTSRSLGISPEDSPTPDESCLSVFCHECGARYVTRTAKFCCMCGTGRTQVTSL